MIETRTRRAAKRAAAAKGTAAAAAVPDEASLAPAAVPDQAGLAPAGDETIQDVDGDQAARHVDGDQAARHVDGDQADDTPGPSRTALFITFVAVVGLLALFGVKLASDSGWIKGGLLSGNDGRPASLTSGQLDKTVLRQAPDFTLQLFSGDSLSLAALRGKPVVVNFWASWCAPCRQEAPVLERLSREYAAKGVVFVGIDLWDTDRDASTFMREYGVSYASGADPRGKIAIGYGLAGIPETFFVDRDGQITRKWAGPLTEQSLRAYLDELLAT